MRRDKVKMTRSLGAGSESVTVLTTIPVAIMSGRTAGQRSGSCGLGFRISCLVPFLGHNHN